MYALYNVLELVLSAAVEGLTLTVLINHNSRKLGIKWLACFKTITEAVAQKCSVKKVFLEISQNSQHLYQSSQACIFIKKETLAQVFSYEFCEISKNAFSYRTPSVAASEPVELVLLWAVSKLP